MASFTTFLNLRKPGNEYITRVGDLSNNLDIVDAALDTRNDALVSFNGSVSNLESAWTAFVPVFVNVTLGNGVVGGRYKQVGKTVHWAAQIVFGSTSALTGLAVSVSLPVAAKNINPFPRYPLCKGFYINPYTGTKEYQNLVGSIEQAVSPATHAYLYWDKGALTWTDLAFAQDAMISVFGTYEAN